MSRNDCNNSHNINHNNYCEKRYVIGPTGAQGPRGPVGPAGPTGATGPAVISYYGSFYDNTNQVNTTPFTDIAIIFSETILTPNGVSVILDSQPIPKSTIIQINNIGVYNLQLSVQLSLTGSPQTNYDISIWLYDYSAGAPVANTSRTVTVVNNNTAILSFNLFLNVVNVNNQYQILWFSPATNLVLRYYEPSLNIPGNPSAILTINKVS